MEDGRRNFKIYFLRVCNNQGLPWEGEGRRYNNDTREHAIFGKSVTHGTTVRLSLWLVNDRHSAFFIFYHHYRDCLFFDNLLLLFLEK